MTKLSSSLAVTPVETVLRRVASEVGAVADGLAVLEAQVGALAALSSNTAIEHESLQAFDEISQSLRAVESFLHAASTAAEGDVALAAALARVSIDTVRARLAGEKTVPVDAEDPEIW